LIDATLEIDISDNGNAPSSSLARSGHYGVRGMQERAEALGGSVVFASQDAGGLKVLVRLPLPLLVQGAAASTVTAPAAPQVSA
jgi:signal transduction histidine kinase